MAGRQAGEGKRRSKTSERIKEKEQKKNKLNTKDK
jgi:hypothetical protein